MRLTNFMSWIFLIILALPCTDATCAELSTLGTIVLENMRQLYCQAAGGAWVLDCCIRCAENLRGGVVRGNSIYSSLSDALSSNLSNSLNSNNLELLPGLYTGIENCHLSLVENQMHIIGVCGAHFTAIDCGKLYYHMKISGRNFILEGLTLLNGFSYQNGGCIAIALPATGITVVDSVLYHCVSYQNGGAISFDGTSPDVVSQNLSITIRGNSRIENCSASQKGGAFYIVVTNRWRPLPILFIGYYRKFIKSLSQFRSILNVRSLCSSSLCSENLYSTKNVIISFLVSGQTVISYNQAGSNGGAVALVMQR
jgi:hypothetical protein